MDFQTRISDLRPVASRLAHFSRTLAENQPRRNEEHEDFFSSSFVLFVSSWLIFILSGRRSLRHE
jgi:hypothetical protein